MLTSSPWFFRSVGWMFDAVLQRLIGRAADVAGVDVGRAALAGCGHACLNRAIDHCEHESAAEALPEMRVHLAVEAGAAEWIAGRAVQVDDDTGRSFGAGPKNEEAILALAHPALELPHDLRAAIKQGNSGLARDVLRNDAGDEAGEGRIHRGLQYAGDHRPFRQQVRLVPKDIRRDAAYRGRL